MSACTRIGLIGLGRHGLRYARHLRAGDVPGAELTRVWTRDPDKRTRSAREFEVQACDDLDDLAGARDVDAVIAAVPAGAHLAVARACAAHHRPLLLEKPLARTTSEGVEICAAMDGADALLMVAQTLRFDPLLIALRRRLPELGRITGASFEQRLEPRGLAWEDDPEASGGGVLLQTAIHTLDAMRFVTDAAAARVVAASTDRVQYEHNEDLGLVHLRLEGGPTLTRPILGDVRVSKIGGSRHMRFAVYGEAGGLEADFIERQLILTRGRERVREPIAEAPTVVAAARHFVAAARGEAPNPVPGKDALASLGLVQSAYAEARKST